MARLERPFAPSPATCDDILHQHLMYVNKPHFALRKTLLPHLTPTMPNVLARPERLQVLLPRFIRMVEVASESGDEFAAARVLSAIFVSVRQLTAQLLPVPAPTIPTLDLIYREHEDWYRRCQVDGSVLELFDRATFSWLVIFIKLLLSHNTSFQQREPPPCWVGHERMEAWLRARFPYQMHRTFIHNFREAVNRWVGPEVESDAAEGEETRAAMWLIEGDEENFPFLTWGHLYDDDAPSEDESDDSTLRGDDDTINTRAEFRPDETPVEYVPAGPRVSRELFCIPCSAVSESCEACGVCGDPMEQQVATSNANGDIVLARVCRHMFHGGCLDHWVNESAMANSNRCPVCRAELCQPRACVHETTQL